MKFILFISLLISIIFNANASNSYNTKEVSKFIDYMATNKLKFVHDIIKAHGKQKKKFVVGNNGNDEQAWNEVVQVLRSINMTPQEALDYSIGSVQTKQRFMELRVFREYKNNAKYTINSFIKIYRKHLASKKPLKFFAVSDEFRKWSVDNDINFNNFEIQSWRELSRCFILIIYFN